MDPNPIAPPLSGHYRLSCGEPCTLSSAERFGRRGTVWNVGTGGAYVVLPGTLPPVGSTVLLTFALPGDPRRISCEARVQWQNPPSVFRAWGAAKPALPAGCGMAFVRIEPADADRIVGRVSASGELSSGEAVARRKATWTRRLAGFI